jgi:hypothetical protein
MASRLFRFRLALIQLNLKLIAKIQVQGTSIYTVCYNWDNYTT